MKQYITIVIGCLVWCSLFLSFTNDEMQDIHEPALQKSTGGSIAGSFLFYDCIIDGPLPSHKQFTCDSTLVKLTGGVYLQATLFNQSNTKEFVSLLIMRKGDSAIFSADITYALDINNQYKFLEDIESGSSRLKIDRVTAHLLEAHFDILNGEDVQKNKGFLVKGELKINY